jgi:hypothetical protein
MILWSLSNEIFWPLKEYYSVFAESKTVEAEK